MKNAVIMMMKRTMKKAVTLLTVTTVGMSLLTGCSLFKPTAESLLTACTKKMADVKNMDFDVTMDLGMSMSQDGTGLDIDMTMCMDALYEKKAEDEYQVQAETEVNLEMLGMNQSTKAESYIVGKGDTVTTYTKEEDAEEWVKEEEEKEESDSMNFDFTNLIEQLTLAEETETENGKECYVLEGDVENNDMGSLLEGMDMGDVNTEDMKVHMVMKVDKKEKLPVSMTMEVDEEIFESIFSQEDLEALGDVSVEVDKFEIAIIFNEIDGDITVEVPKEALEAEEAEGDNDTFNLFNTSSEDTQDNSEDESDEDSEGIFGGADDSEEDSEGLFGGADDSEEISEEEDDETEGLFGAQDDDSDDTEEADDYYESETDDYEIVIDEDSISKEEFEAAGYKCQEFSSEDEIYLMMTNNNNQTKDVEVYVYFKKGDKIVDWSYDETTMQSGDTHVVNFFYSEDYDSVLFTFEEKDTEGETVTGDDFAITYDIDEEGKVTGTITNNSGKTVSFAKVHIVLMNANHEVIGFEDAYAEEDLMEAGATQNFVTYLDNVEYDNVQIYGSATVEE